MAVWGRGQRPADIHPLPLIPAKPEPVTDGCKVHHEGHNGITKDTTGPAPDSQPVVPFVISFVSLVMNLLRLLRPSGSKPGCAGMIQIG